MTNRLNLNFKLETKEERVEFARTYLESLTFTPNADELDTIAKYILWGKSPNGLNGRQEGLELETRYKTWNPFQPESYEALLESPAFSESTLRRPNDPPLKIARETFSRKTAREKAPPHVLADLEKLWRTIDETELLITLYDLAHDKRTSAPRPELLKRFSSAEIDAINTRAQTIAPYKYLKLRHNLVELRREQYTLKDEYSTPHTLNSTFTFSPDTSTPPIFGEDINVLPIGIPHNSTLSAKIFNTQRYPIPSDFTDSELKAISTLLWTPIKKTENSYFDFTNTDHLYKLFEMWDLLQDEVEEVCVESTLKFFLRAASMYRALANLDPVLEEIFELKLRKTSNQDIVDIINPKYNKTYQPNYISTLYCKKCLGKIANAAAYHRTVLENIFFPENFKICSTCGATLLIDTENFMHRKRSPDGFSSRCKRCEKIARERRKHEN